MSLDTHQAQIITEVYNKMYKQLLAYARNSLGQEYLVEESVQDTFRIACAKYDEFIPANAISIIRIIPKLSTNFFANTDQHLIACRMA